MRASGGPTATYPCPLAGAGSPSIFCGGRTVRQIDRTRSPSSPQSAEGRSPRRPRVHISHKVSVDDAPADAAPELEGWTRVEGVGRWPISTPRRPVSLDRAARRTSFSSAARPVDRTLLARTLARARRDQPASSPHKWTPPSRGIGLATGAAALSARASTGTGGWAAGWQSCLQPCPDVRVMKVQRNQRTGGYNRIKEATDVAKAAKASRRPPTLRVVEAGRQRAVMSARKGTERKS